MKFRKWAGIAAGGLLLSALGFAGWVYAASEMHFRSFPPPPAFARAIPDDAASIAHGEQLVATRGCRGCHGAQLEGAVMWGTADTPNLAAYARRHPAATFEAALRHGIGANGRALYSMPSYNFTRLSDDDVAALYAYLRSAPVSMAAPQDERFPWHRRALLEFAVRFNIARGDDATMPAYLDQVAALTHQNDPDPGIARGEYLAMTSCIECHGFDLRAHSPWPGDTAPDLAVVGAYSPEQFARLMREGVPLSGAELPMMGPVARGRFSHWTDQDVVDLYAFLSDMSRRAGVAPRVD